MFKKLISGIISALLLSSMIYFAALSSATEVAGSMGILSGDFGDFGVTEDWWLMFRYDQNHTGCSSSNTPPPIAWLKNTTLSNKVRSSPAVVNDVVFVGSSDGHVYRWDMNTHILLPSSTYGAIYSSPAVVEGVVYVGSNDGHVYALNAANLAYIKSLTTGGAVKSSPVVVEGILYVGSSDGYLYAWNISKSREDWKLWTASSIESSPVVYGNTIIFGTNDGRVYALEKEGRIKWFFKTDGGSAITSSPAVADGIVFVGSNDTKVYALNATTGMHIWNYTTGEAVTSSPAIAHDMVFVGSDDKNVYALNASTSALIWSYATGGCVHSSPAVSADGILFVGSCDNKIYAFNVSTGNLIWNYTTKGPVYSSPAIAKGRIFIGSDDSNLYVFETPNTLPVAIMTHYPENPIIYNTVTFDASDSNDSDGYITKYSWNFGDGKTDSGKTVTHVYEAARPYTVNLTVTDDRGGLNSTLPSITVLEAWPMFRHDPKHWANSTSWAPVTGARLWVQPIGGSSTDENLWSSPIVIGSNVYVASREGNVYKLNASDGSVLLSWPVKPGGEIHSSPAYYNDMIFVGSLDGYVYALNASSGKKMWNSTKFGGGMESSPVVSDGLVFVGSQDNYVHALYAINGTQLWVSDNTGGDVVSSPAVVGGMVFVGSDGKKVYALNKTDGKKIIWSNSTGDWVRSSPAVAYGRVFVGSDDGYVYALDVTNGNIKWKYKIGNDIKSSPAVADGMVFIGSDDGNLYALNATTSNPSGEKIWNRTIGSIRWSSPAVAEGKVFIGTTDGKIYALREKNGEIWWWNQTSGAVDSSPAVLSDIVYVSSKDGNIYAFGGKVHNIAVVNAFSSPPEKVAQNTTANITVDVENQGSFNETNINVTAQYNSSLFYNATINLTRGKPQRLQFPWDTTGIENRTYTIYVNASKVPDETNIIDNTKFFNITVEIGKHDIAVVNVTNSKEGCLPMPVVGQGYNVTVKVTVKNQGNFTEIFDVTVYANETIVQTQTINLTEGDSRTLTFKWNTTGFAKGNYTIKAIADTVSGETDTDDNTKVDGIVLVSIAGDVNGDHLVDISDLSIVVNATPSAPGWPNWNPNADINDDGVCDISDLVTCIDNIPSGPW
jgi:outer membrane protein assembly factor BamB